MKHQHQIWKFPLQIVAEQVIEMPYASDIICVQVQHGAICLWAEVMPDLPDKEKRTFRIIGTGQDFVKEGFFDYIGTVQTGDYVWHVYETAEEE